MKLWTVPWQEIGCGQVSWADGRLYVFGEENGKVSLVEPSAAGGKLVGKFQIEGTGKSWAYPVVTGGRLYLRYGTNLYCYNIKAGGN